MYEEDIDRMRQVFAINPKMQEMMAKFFDEPFAYGCSNYTSLTIKTRFTEYFAQSIEYEVLNHQTNRALEAQRIPQYFKGCDGFVHFLPAAFLGTFLYLSKPALDNPRIRHTVGAHL